MLNSHISTKDLEFFCLFLRDFMKKPPKISPPSFLVPLQPALNEGLFCVVANVAVADRNKPFPTFRSRVIGADGQPGPWWLWDGQKEEMLRRDLTDTEKHYSLRGISSAPLLVERIESGYRPETHSI